MKKSIVIFLAVLLAGIRAFALEVDVDEIKNTKKVNFINYTGKHRTFETPREVREIGGKLAAGISKKSVNDRFRYHMKYSVIRAISKDDPGKLSADIISIDRDAKVDHVKNIQRIIAGYLQSMYSYSEKNANTLALFTLYYNAVYRGNLDYYSTKYKKVVMGNITRENAGISTVYYEWPGRTKLIIPLTEEAKRGKLDSIDPFILGDEKTKGEIRKDKKAIEERKDMVDIKKRVVDKEKTEIDREKKAVEKKKEQIEEKKKETARKEEQIKKEKKAAEEIKEPEKRKEKEKEIEKKEEELKKDKETVKKEEKEIEKKKEDIKKEEKETAKKEEQIKKEEKEIAKDEKKGPDADSLKQKEKELDKREDKLRDKDLDKNIYGLKLYYLKIKEYLEDGHYNNDMYMIDASQRKVLFKSPVTNICGSRYDVFSGGVVVITHTGNHKAGHHLTLIDKETLAAKVEGKDNVFWRSFIEIRDGYIYALTAENGKYYLGRFDGTLKLVARSKEEVSENTFVSFFENYIYINRANNQIMVLNKEDLSLIDEIKP